MPTRKWGAETQANTTVAGPQLAPRVAVAPNGRFMVVWQDNGPSASAVRGQVFSPAGIPIGAEITIAAVPGNDMLTPTVAALADGTFYATYVQEVGQDNYIFGAVYNGDGALVRQQDVVFAFGFDREPQVARIGTGSIVVWRDPEAGDLLTRSFDSAGVGGSIEPDGLGGGTELVPRIAVSPDQRLLLIASLNETTNAINLQVFDPPNPTFHFGGFSPVATAGAVDTDPAVTWLSDTHFVLTWSRLLVGGGPVRGLDIMACIFTYVANSTLTPVTDAFTVNTTFQATQETPSVTALANGDFVVAWTDHSGPDSLLSAIRLQAFDIAGNRIGRETVVNTSAGGAEAQPSVAAMPDGRVVVTWTGDSDTPEGQGADIRVQIIDPRDGIVTGGSKADTLYGHDNVADEITGYGGNDTLFGLRGDDALYGGAGDDTLEGGAGADDLYGGTGNDLMILDQAGDVVVEAALQGNDTVQSGAISLDLARYLNVENVTLTGGLALSARGNTTANILNGAANSAANVLTGLAGNDTYIVGAGDTVVEAAGGGVDTVQSSLINLALASYPGVENITLLGGLPLKATGNDGANTIDGSQNPAANVLVGLGGNDTFIVGAGDSIVEVAGGGTDTVQSALINLNLALYPGVQNVVLTGALPLSATGDASANVLDGAQNSAANELTGLGGDDTYLLGVGDTVVEGLGGGTDTLRSAVVSLNITALPDVENLVLTGSLPLSASGNAAANVIDGASNTAANQLIGGNGNDIFIVDANDQVLEFSIGGVDTVQSAVASLNLGAYGNVEAANLTGALPLFAIGTAFGDSLSGESNSAANVLTGLDGADTYGVGAGDTIVETLTGGIDTVQSASISLNLAAYANVENITLAGTLALSATGTAGANTLNGAANSAANALAGLGGDDLYIVGAGDTVDEAVGGGNDRVLTAVNYTLKAGAEVEQIFVSGTFAGLSLTGNALPQRIQGGIGNDTLTGGGGGDILVGVGGTDTLVGGLGADTFLFQLLSDTGVGAARDVVKNFVPAEGDRIDLSLLDADSAVFGDQPFTFRGTAPFTGANGEVRYVASGPDLVVQGYISAGVVFEIGVAGIAALSAGDFKL